MPVAHVTESAAALHSPGRGPSAARGLTAVVNGLMELVLSPEAVARRRIARAARTEAATLNLSCMKLSSLPPQIGALVKLRVLHLWHNQLTSLPAHLGRCVALEELYLSDNELASLPDSLLHLPHLRRLFLHGNPKLHVPDTVLGPRWEVVMNSGTAAASARAILEHYFHRHSL